MEKRISIPLAGERQVYDVKHVTTALEAMQPEENPTLRRTYERMVAKGGSRWLIKPSSTSTFDWLYEVCPNFEPVIDDLKKYLHLAIFGDGPISFMPILLTGDPGVGKTHFSKCLAEALATEFELLSMSSMTAGFVLSGSAPTWKGAKAGKVADRLINGTVANPVFLMDELDKAGGDSQHDVNGPLYQLLEGETNANFKDEFIDIEFDCSKVFWIASANEPSFLPKAIFSRMAVYEVQPPTREQGRRIGQAIYKRLLEQHNWAFEPEMSERALDSVETITPREMKKRILDALGAALVAGRRHLEQDDFKVSTGPQAKPAIGFVSSR